MVRINLLPIRDILRRRELKQFFLLTGVAALAVVAVCVLTYVFFSIQEANLEAERRSHQEKLNKLKEKNKEITELKNEITRLQKQVDTIQKLTKIRDTPAPFMAALSLAVPDAVWLKTITKTHRNFTLVGTGVDNTVVVNFVERLQKLRQEFTPQQPWLDPRNEKEQSFFKDVRLVSIVAGRATTGLDTVGFQITGHLR
ncbi:MAG: PilN domain-containing protein [Desulfomonilaceae bacterium]|nr:PilN domain-containing protein [Desulfomonilaceae bacterium]